MSIRKLLGEFNLTHPGIYSIYKRSPLGRFRAMQYKLLVFQMCEESKETIRQSRKCIIDMNEVKLKVDPLSNHDLEMYHMWMNNEIYEPNDLPFLLEIMKHSFNLAEIGANNGYYTILGAKKVKGTVHAFEPDKYSYFRLIENIKLNGIANVKTYNIALSDSEGEMTFYRSDLEDGFNTLIPMVGAISSNKVKVDTLDNVLGDANVDFITMDVEGYEEEVLKGGSEHLKDSPIVFFEFNRDLLTMRKKHPNILLSCLQRYGYKIYLSTIEGKLRRIRSQKDLPYIVVNLFAFKDLPDYLQEYQEE